MKKGVKVLGLIAVLIVIGSLFVGIVSTEVIVAAVNKDIAATNVNVTPTSPKGDLELVRGDDETDTSTKNKTEWIKVTPTSTHDMVVTNVNTTPSSPDLEQPTVIYVTVTNEGEQQEDNVSVKGYVDSAQIGSTQYISLAPGLSNTTTFLWSPTTAKAYSVKGEVGIVNGEIDVKDNTKRVRVKVSAVPTPMPGTPGNPSPSNHTTDVYINTNLDWSDCSNTDFYDVYFGTYTHPPYYGNAPTSNHPFQNDLDYNTKYYWKIVAKSNGGGITQGPIWDFNTEEEPNQQPTAIIDSITPDPAEQGTDTVSFTGHGTDPDGTVVAYNWSSSIDGPLSTSTAFTKPASELSVGTHAIYFKVQDNDGTWSTEDTEDLTIYPANVAPTAIIDSITLDPAEQGTDTVSFSGHGTDTDGTVAAYNWSSSIDGPLSTSTAFTKPASELSIGTHAIYFKVQDDDGTWSTEDTEDLTIYPANVPPTAIIDSITPDPAEQGTDTVSFSGHGTDTDGTVAAYNWSSSIDGPLNTSAAFSKQASELSVGTHAIYFKVQDNDGAWSTEDKADLTINPANVAPTAIIDSITPDPAEHGTDTVSFSGHGTDTDGTVAAYNWSSSIDGPLNTSAAFTKPASELSVGTHTIYFKVQDNDGAWSTEDTEDLTINPANVPPTAIIDSITPDPAEQGTDTVSFTGHGTDTDGTVAAYNWSSSIDGPLSTSASFTKPASELSVGTHTIYFKVQDNDGAWSTEDTEDLTINPANVPSTPTPTPTHDMVVTNVNTTPSSPDLEQPTVIYVTVTNEGEQQEDNVSVKVYVDSAQIGTTQYISLAPGSSNTTTFLWTPTTAKAYSVKGEVEIVNGEIDVKDNIKSIKVRVSAVPTPTPTHDMVVTNVNTTPSSPDLEQPTVIYVTVTNEGEQQEDNVSVKVYVDSAQIGTTQYISLAPGSRNTTTFLWTPTTAKAYSIKGEVEIVNGEIDVKDNIKSIKVRVSAVPTPTPTPTQVPAVPDTGSHSKDNIISDEEYSVVPTEDVSGGLKQSVVDKAPSKDNIISDEEYRDYQSMSVDQIQNFLENPRWGDGYLGRQSYLATYRTYDYQGVERSAAEIIYNAARDYVDQGYQISPEVILTTLQKEQSLITTTGQPTGWQLDCAMGYAVGNDAYKGFGKQVDAGGWQLGYDYKYIEIHGSKNGWGVGISKQTLDGVTITPQNIATASLYDYTPHAGAGWGGSGGGNYLFWDLYYEKFGFGASGTSSGYVDSPYIHQTYDTLDDFIGSWACAPTSAVMVLAYYGRFLPDPVWVSYPSPGHYSDYGRYISDEYTYTGYTFSNVHTESTECGTATGKGAWGYIWQEGVGHVKDNLIDYLELHDFTVYYAHYDEASARDLVQLEIDNDRPLIARTYLTSGGHYVVVVGYETDAYGNFWYKVNDPFGDEPYGNGCNGDYGVSQPVSYSYSHMGLDHSSRGLITIQSSGEDPKRITPLSGDLNDDGTDSYGTFDSSTAGFTFNGKTVHFGTSTDLPVMGDWDNDGSDEIGIYRPDNGGGQSEFHLVWQDWGFFSDGASVDAAYRKVIPFGYYPNNIPIAGDWDGINNDDIGGFCNNKFYLYSLNWGLGTATPYAGDPSLGDPGDNPIIGDWDGDGDDDIGVFRSGADTNYFYLEGYLEFPPYSFGNVGDEPLIGDWDGDGDDDIGVYRPGDNPPFHPNYPPTLSNGYVAPASGDTSTTFDYYVTYTDSNNDEPTTKYVYVDGSPQTMTMVSGSYTSGATFKYSTTLSAGSHNYYFYFDDGHSHTVRLPTSGTYSGPTVSTSNDPPNTPSRPSGLTSGQIGISYPYSMVTTDPNSDNVYYWFDWGDGTNSGWIGPYPSGTSGSASKEWSDPGTYNVKAKAKDEHGAESSPLWSDSLPVCINGLWEDDPNNPCKKRKLTCTGEYEYQNKDDGTICGCTASNTLKQCYSGVCTDTGICDSTTCGADAACDGKKPGDSCGGGICDSNCKCGGPAVGEAIAVFRNGMWALKYGPVNLIPDFPPADKWVFFGGGSGWTPIKGDFNDDGFGDIGLYQDGQWALKYGPVNEIPNFQGADKWVFFGGGSGWMPLVGDFNDDGVDDIALFNGGQFALKYGPVKDIPNWPAADKWVAFGAGGWTPIVGDFNNDGTDDIGEYSNGQWALKYGPVKDIGFWPAADKWVFFGGGSGWTPLVGDGNNDNIDDIALFQNGQWALKYGPVKDIPDWAAADKWVFFATGGWTPLVGDFGSDVA